MTRKPYEVLIRAKVHLPDDDEARSSFEQAVMDELDGFEIADVDGGADSLDNIDVALDVQSVRVIAVGSVVTVA